MMPASIAEILRADGVAAAEIRAQRAERAVARSTIPTDLHRTRAELFNRGAPGNHPRIGDRVLRDFHPKRDGARRVRRDAVEMGAGLEPAVEAQRLTVWARGAGGGEILRVSNFELGVCGIDRVPGDAGFDDVSDHFIERPVDEINPRRNPFE